MIQGGTQDEIELIEVIRTCTVVELDAVFADDCSNVRVDPRRSEAMSVEAKTAIIEHLGRQHQAMVALLADLVNIDSGSYNKRGVDAVGDRLRAWLEAAGISCEIFPNEIFGDCMAARIPGTGGGNRPIVLMGHRDTVFPDGTAAQRPFRIDGDQAFGPGVADMKAGLVMNTFVLEALRRFGAPCPLDRSLHLG